MTNAEALAVPPDQVGADSGVRCTVVEDADALARHFADAMVAEFKAGRASGRPQVVFIVPVGPIGQFELLAERCNSERLPPSS